MCLETICNDGHSTVASSLAGAFPRDFIEYALLKTLGYSPYMEPGVKPCCRKWLKSISQGKMGSQNSKLNTIS